MRRSPKRWTLPIAATMVRSSTAAMAGRCTVAQNTSVPYTTALPSTAINAAHVARTITMPHSLKC